jgi:hypothetical protein
VNHRTSMPWGEVWSKWRRITPSNVMILNEQFVKSDRIDMENIEWLSISFVLKPRWWWFSWSFSFRWLNLDC